MVLGKKLKILEVEHDFKNIDCEFSKNMGDGKYKKYYKLFCDKFCMAFYKLLNIILKNTR